MAAILNLEDEILFNFLVKITIRENQAGGGLCRLG